MPSFFKIALYSYSWDSCCVSAAPAFTCCKTVVPSGNSGFCGRYPTWIPPAFVTKPWSGSSTPAIIFSRVDLPVPLTPMMPIFSPFLYTKGNVVEKGVFRYNFFNMFCCENCHGFYSRFFICGYYIPSLNCGQLKSRYPLILDNKILYPPGHQWAHRITLGIPSERRSLFLIKQRKRLQKQPLLIHSFI